MWPFKLPVPRSVQSTKEVERHERSVDLVPLFCFRGQQTLDECEAKDGYGRRRPQGRTTSPHSPDNIHSFFALIHRLHPLQLPKDIFPGRPMKVESGPYSSGVDCTNVSIDQSM